jgi:hypothetical protein
MKASEYDTDRLHKVLTFIKSFTGGDEESLKLDKKEDGRREEGMKLWYSKICTIYSV